MVGNFKDIVREYRNKKIVGVCVELIPLSDEYAEDIVRLRNEPRNMYCLHQTHTVTVEDQLRWYDSYLERDNDLYWCILDRSGGFIGTVRIYGIDPDEDICEHGSFIIDEKAAFGPPFAVEAMLLSLDFAFDVLKSGRVLNDTRDDNTVMNRINSRLGFEFYRENILNGDRYSYRYLTSDKYSANRSGFAKPVEYWSTRLSDKM